MEVKGFPLYGKPMVSTVPRSGRRRELIEVVIEAIVVCEDKVGRVGQGYGSRLDQGAHGGTPEAKE